MSHQVTFELGSYKVKELKASFVALGWKAIETRHGMLFTMQHSDCHYPVSAVDRKGKVQLSYDSDIRFDKTTLGKDAEFLKQQYQIEATRSHVQELHGRIKDEMRNEETGVVTLTLEVTI